MSLGGKSNRIKSSGAKRKELLPSITAARRRRGVHFYVGATFKVVSRGWRAVPHDQTVTATARCVTRTSFGVGLPGSDLGRADRDVIVGWRISR
jgi:hypothetical protein